MTNNHAENGFGGILAAAPSPCDEQDEFLEDVFSDLIAKLFTTEVRGVYVCGLNGSGHRMRTAERQRATEIAVGLSREYGRKVIVQIGACNLRDAVQLACHAAETGADAIASLPLAGCSPAQLRYYYHEVAGAAQIPLFIYYFPAWGNVTYSLSELLSLADIEGVAGLKFTDWNLWLIRELLIRRPDLVIFSGYDQILLPALLYGASGGIGRWASVFPQSFARIYESVRKRDYAHALRLQESVLSFLSFTAEYGNEAVFELLMAQRGYGPYCFRRPRLSLDPPTRSKLRSELEERLAMLEETSRCEPASAPSSEEQTSSGVIGASPRGAHGTGLEKREAVLDR